MDNPTPREKKIPAIQDETFEIRLWEDRTRGELWVPSYDPACLVLVNDEYLRTANGNAVDSGRRLFEFRALKPGTNHLVFDKRMGWKFTAEDQRVFLIEVSPVAEETGTREG